MAQYQLFDGTSRPVLIEVADGDGGNATGSLVDAVAVLTDIAAACGSAVNRLPTDRKPSELKVEFGLRALDDGSMAVSLDRTNSSFVVTMTWSGGGAAATPTASPAVPAMPPVPTQ
jgi:hypothetical protein